MDHADAIALARNWLHSLQLAPMKLIAKVNCPQKT